MNAVQGKKLAYLYRVLENAPAEVGTVISFVTDNGKTISKDADSTATKGGTIRTPGTTEVEITSTSILAVNDILIGKLKQAMLDDEIIEIWEVNLEEPVGGSKFKGTYYQGYLTNLDVTSGAEDFVEIDTTFAINGEGVDGYVTVTDDQQEAAQYVFTDTVIQTPGITLDDSTVSVAEGLSIALGYTAVPYNSEVTWTSSAEGKATVEDGVVTGVSAGSATITAKITYDGTDYTDTCTVTVTS